ncbi:MAG: tripartite tricarboxylate transporter permease [Anaerovoracaceae bacterium]
MSTLFIGLQAFLEEPILFVLLAAGVFFGMVFGAIPGLTAALAVSLLLPFTFAMTASQGITTLIGVYVGGISGGLIAAVLLNIPGSPASLVTCFDGTPMARNGRANDALTIGVFSSFMGGLMSALLLMAIAPQLAKIALLFGSWEYFAMGLMGLSVVVSLCSDDKIKGFIAAIVGLILAMVGMDAVSGVPRLTFGFWQLNGGLDTLDVLMGLFAMTEVLQQLKTIDRKFEISDPGKVKAVPTREMLKGTLKTHIMGGLIGTFIGILPGIGQTTASLMSYSTCMQTSDHPEKFGTGITEGVVASEVANNSCCGGALIPMMTLGIPGDLVTSILLGGLIVHGLQPGPLLFTSSADIVGIIFAAYLLANIIMYIMEMGLMKVFIKLLKVPMNLLFPIILLMCVVGTITVNNRIFDSWVLLVVGIIGYYLVNNGFPLAPIVLGYILGSIIESNMRTALISNQANFLSLFSKPISVGLLIFAVIMLILPSILKKRSEKKQQKRTSEA